MTCLHCINNQPKTGLHLSDKESLREYCDMLIAQIESQIGERDPLVTELIERDLHASSH